MDVKTIKDTFSGAALAMIELERRGGKFRTPSGVEIDPYKVRHALDTVEKEINELRAERDHYKRQSSQRGGVPFRWNGGPL